MKGDFTRFTFQPKKHYTSVRMQQGRLQLDSDWNEQVDIQNHLRHQQTVDVIGAASGVPTQAGNTDEPYRDSFKLSATFEVTEKEPQEPEASAETEVTETEESQEPEVPAEVASAQGNTWVNDLAIAPGRLYANGTLCELEDGTPFEATVQAEDQVIVKSLLIDNRPLQKGQWLAFEPPEPKPGPELDPEPDSVKPDQSGEQKSPLTALRYVQIKEIEPKQQALTLEGTLPEKGLKIQLRRVLTYQTQPDYPNPSEGKPLEKGVYLAYVDVWQRHITVAEDPSLREVALGIPDTTTRTKTIWQLKLEKTDTLDLSDPEAAQIIDQAWGKFLVQQSDRQTYLSASTRDPGYRRLENQLYRVEIHQPGKVSDAEGDDSDKVSDAGGGDSDESIATFKWSRDNGSVVSLIEKIDGNTILIRKSSQDAWIDSQPGQWIEITTEEMELKGKPGVLVPLLRASDTKIEFDESRIENGPIPKTASKVRRWDHTSQAAALLTRSEPQELEAGINVKFDLESEYKTGDYWVIPARAAIADIEWPTDQDEDNPKPLPQPPHGIAHEYALLAVVEVDDNGQFKSTLLDKRVIFPPLMNCLDRTGGVITGWLEIQSNLYVTGKYQKELNRYVEGLVGIGTKQPSARLHTKAVKPIPGKGTLLFQGKQATGVGTQFTKELQVGDLLYLGESPEPRIVAAISSDTSLTLDQEATIPGPVPLQYQGAIARFEDHQENAQPHLVVLASGKTGIGTALPQNKLDVAGGVAIGSAYAGNQPAPNQGLIVEGNTGIGTAIPGAKLSVLGNVAIGGADYANAPSLPSNGLIVQGNVGFGTPNPAQQLVIGSNGRVGIGYNEVGQTAALSVSGKVGIGTTEPQARLEVRAIAPDDGDTAVLFQVKKSDNSNLLSVRQGGAIQLGTPNSNGVQLTVSGTANISHTATLAPTPGSQVLIGGGTGTSNIKLDVTGNAKFSGSLQVEQTATLATASNSRVVIGNVAQSTTKLTVEGSVRATNFLGDGSTLDGLVKKAGDTMTGSLTIQQGLTVTGTAKFGRLQLNDNLAIAQFSDDSNLQSRSDTALTEKAVKTFVDGQIQGINTRLNQKADRSELNQKANVSDLNQKADRSELNQKANVSDLNQKADRSELAQKADIADLNQRAKREGDLGQDFSAKDLRAERFFAREISTTEVRSNGFIQISSRSLKAEIVDISNQETQQILETLAPVKFVYTEDQEKHLHIGFIAEDTPAILTAPNQKAIKIMDVVAVLTAVLKDHQKTISDLTKVASKQQLEIDALQERFTSLEDILYE